MSIFNPNKTIFILEMPERPTGSSANLGNIGGSIHDSSIAGRDIIINQTSKHQELLLQEMHRKRDVLRNFLANDVQTIGEAIALVGHLRLSVLFDPDFAIQLHRAINRVYAIEMIFIADEEIRKAVSEIGRLARLAWDRRITKDEFELFLKYNKSLEDALLTLEKKLTL